MAFKGPFHLKKFRDSVIPWEQNHFCNEASSVNRTLAQNKQATEANRKLSRYIGVDFFPTDESMRILPQILITTKLGRQIYKLHLAFTFLSV